MTNKIKVADYLAERLATVHGIKQVFMVTGGGAMHLNDSLSKVPGLDYFCCHHEQACAIAAEGYARACGRPALVNVTSGPGGTNALTGVLGQWTDSVPAIYLSGQIKKETSIHSQPGVPLRQMGDQEGDIISIVKPITKFAATLWEPRDARRILDRAVHLAISGRKGPVWIDVPLDVQSALIDADALPAYDPAEDALPPAAAPPFPALLALLRQAQRPVLVAGHGLRIAGAVEPFRRLMGELSVPVLATFNGVDVSPTGHPAYVGRIGTLGGRAGNFALQNADLALFIGTRNNIRQVSYFWRSYARAAKKVVVDVDAAELQKHTLRPDLPICMDAKDFVEGLLKALQGAEMPDWSEWMAWCAERRQRYPAVQTPEPAPGRLDPYRFIRRLSQLMPDDAMVVGGDGTACVAPFQVGEVREQQRYIWNSGCAAMGFDIPASIGACVGRDRRPVICLAGDGSAMLNLQELATIAFQRLPLRIFLLNNNGYISIRQTQNAYFGGRLHGVDGKSGVGFPDYRRVAEAFGLAVERIADPAEVDDKIRAVLAVEGPVLCEVMLPDDYAFTPKLSSARLPDGRMVSKPLEDLSPLLSREEFMQNMIIPPLQE